MKMYRMTTWSDEPEEFEVVKVTASMVTYIDPRYTKPQRAHKITDYHVWFNTADDARMWKIERARSQVDKYRKEHELALAKLNGLLKRWEHLS